MLLFRKPPPATIRDFLAKQSRLDLIYAAVALVRSVFWSGCRSRRVGVN
jgi:hypothetical protein